MKVILPSILLFAVITTALVIGSVVPGKKTDQFLVLVTEKSDTDAMRLATSANLDLLDRGALTGTYVMSIPNDYTNSIDAVSSLYRAGATLVLKAEPGFGCQTRAGRQSVSPHPFSNYQKDPGA